MRKAKLLLLLMLPFASINAQENPTNTHLSQDFSGSFQTDGWTIENYATQWTKESSSNAGGVSPELRFKYTSGTSTTRFISPSVDLTGVTDLSFSFKQLVDHYGTGYSIGVATRSNQGSWNNIWTTSPSSDIGPETKDIIIANDDVGSSDFQICFFLSGNAYQIDYWYIDDILLFTPFNSDLGVSKINVDTYLPSGSISPAITLKNEGLTEINSFDIKYQIDNGDFITESVNAVSIGRGEVYLHTFAQAWTAIPGNYDLSVYISNINGGDDDNNLNNTLVKSIHIASQTLANLPLFESFTSSTCPPCYTFNTSTFTPFLNTHSDEYAIVKYQMNWPSPGDPYYNNEGGVRRTFYGVAAVPTLMTGGEVTGTNSTSLNANFTSHSSKDAFFEIEATASYTDKTVSASINVTPYITVDGFILHAAVVEKETTGNASTNGETSFKYVMMKMLPDANGTSVSFEDNQTYSVSFNQDLTATKVEQMNDLMLVVFIQDPTTKDIFQSKMVDITLNSGVDTENYFSTKIFPNPNNGNFSIQLPAEVGKANVEIFSTTGSLILSQRIDSNEVRLMNIDQPKGVYMVKITLDNGKSSVSKLVIQ